MSDPADVFPWLELTPWDWACALAVMAAGAVLLRGLFALTEVPDLWGGRPAHLAAFGRQVAALRGGGVPRVLFHECV